MMSNQPGQIVARFRVTTPMFAGDATPQEVKLRIPSFKGLLRFWWRALPEQARLASSKLAENEAALFGSARIGQSRVRLRLDVPGEPQPLTRKMRLDRDGGGPANDRNLIGLGARYLGYGLMQAYGGKKQKTGEVIQAGELDRPCFPAPFELWLHVHLLPGVTDTQAQQVVDALILMGTLGGLGSRVRRGFGSLSLVELLRAGKPVWPGEGKTFEDAFKSWFREQYERAAEDWPEWTAISRRTQVLMLRGRPSESPLSLLDRVGKEMVRYRSWGTSRLGPIDGRGKILGEERSEQNFKGDHDLMKEPPRKRRQHPERIAFGLPHNYGKDTSDQVDPAQPGLDRRASPLFLHIHQTAEKMQPIAVVSFLPARFLPGERPQISVGGQAVPLAGLDELYRPVRDFLARLAGGSECKEKLDVIGLLGMDSGGTP